MKVLVTGASGKLGRSLVELLQLNSIDYSTYSHINPLESVDWSTIDTVINCSGVIPSANIKASDYYLGNVVFLQKLISFCTSKSFIHFSTFSELYRDDIYQKSKMLANSLLIANTHIFTKLDILSLPTLDDDHLIKSIVTSAYEGKRPVVDELDYNYMSFDTVANHILDGLVSGFIKPISENYIMKNLYNEVCKQVSDQLIIKGEKINRRLKENNIYTVCPNFLLSLQS